MNLEVQNPLRRGIFVFTNNQGKVWLSFKYERLLIFCFGCGQMGHSLKECVIVPVSFKEPPKDDLPYSLTLKAEYTLIWKETLEFGYSWRNFMMQSVYVGEGVTYQNTIHQIAADQEEEGGVRRPMETVVVETEKAGSVAEVKILELEISLHDSRDFEIGGKFPHDLRDLNGPKSPSHKGADQNGIECDDVAQIDLGQFNKEEKRGWKWLVKGGKDFEINKTRIGGKRNSSHVDHFEITSGCKIDPHGKRLKTTVSELSTSFCNEPEMSNLEALIASTNLGSTVTNGQVDRSQ